LSAGALSRPAIFLSTTSVRLSRTRAAVSEAGGGGTIIPAGGPPGPPGGAPPDGGRCAWAAGRNSAAPAISIAGTATRANGLSMAPPDCGLHHQHRVTVRVEAIASRDRVRVGALRELLPRERRDQQQQRGAREVEV